MSVDASKKSSQIIYRNFEEELPEDGNLGAVVCAMGVFDGVHIGHRRLISDCIEAAREKGCKSAIITFDIDPTELFAKDSPRKLMTDDDRIALLATLGADYVVVDAFTKAYSQLSPESYIERVLLSELEPAALFVGSDFRFGHMAAGTVETLRAILEPRGCEVVAHELLECDGEVVTASRIRDLVQSGSIELVNELLGRTHFMHAIVVEGRKEGRKLGFPTANLVPVIDYAKMADGVYAGYVRVEGEWFKSAISVGVPKTFGDIEWTIEANILDFDRDIYGLQVDACFSRFLRPMQAFNGLDELIAAIRNNVAQTAELPPHPAL